MFSQFSSVSRRRFLRTTALGAAATATGLLHAPTVRIKQLASAPGGDSYADCTAILRLSENHCQSGSPEMPSRPLHRKSGAPPAARTIGPEAPGSLSTCIRSERRP